MISLIYDGSFAGLLTSIFEVYGYKYADVKIIPETEALFSLFDSKHYVVTDPAKANRIIAAVEKYSSTQVVRDLMRVFLSEDQDREMLIFFAVKMMLDEKRDVFTNFGNEHILKIAQLVKSVRREKHRMEAFIRFRLLQDTMFYAVIEPDFDVLPLIMEHFKKRYTNQSWIIFDLRRAYGLLYDLKTVEFFEITEDHYSFLKNPAAILHDDEKPYEDLWRTYFKHTNIKERINKKLHRQHIPLRYWKYLTEKA